MSSWAGSFVAHNWCVFGAKCQWCHAESRWNGRVGFRVQMESRSKSHFWFLKATARRPTSKFVTPLQDPPAGPPVQHLGEICKVSASVPKESTTLHNHTEVYKREIFCFLLMVAWICHRPHLGKGRNEVQCKKSWVLMCCKVFHVGECVCHRWHEMLTCQHVVQVTMCSFPKNPMSCVHFWSCFTGWTCVLQSTTTWLAVSWGSTHREREVRAGHNAWGVQEYWKRFFLCDTSASKDAHNVWL